MAKRTRANLPDLFTRAEWAELARALGLSRRQLEVARLICRGLTNDAIAKRLGTKLDTVRMHTRGLYRRLEVNSRVGVAVRLFIKYRDDNCL